MKTIKFQVGVTNSSFLTQDDPLSIQCADHIFGGISYPVPAWIKDPKVVLDIGGHVGEFSVLMKAIFPQAEVHCFEPNPEVQAILQENATKHGFFVHETAVSDYTGQAELRISGYGAVANSILERPNQTGQSVSVECMDAKLLVDWNPEIVKIDAEGVELTILSRLNLAAINLIYVEFHTEAERVGIDALMLTTHALFYARIGHPEQGELMYVRRKTNL